ncbi:histidine kinase family protein [Mycobacterium xenopi 3993]|nr:histidine kinase family protein [Mycobacterium xenopi 3993]
MIEAQEIERRRLASDIHDGITQRLITLAYRLDAAARAMRDDQAGHPHNSTRHVNSSNRRCWRPVRPFAGCGRQFSTISASQADWPASPARFPDRPGSGAGRYPIARAH